MAEKMERDQDQTLALVSASQAAHLSARIGRLLFANGADTRHVSRCVTRVARDLGHAAHVLVTPEAILATVGTNEQFATKVGSEIMAPVVNMGRLAALRELTDDIRNGLIDADAIDRRLDALESAPARYSAYVVIAGVALTTASLAKLFGASWAVVAASLLAGLVSAVLRHILPSLTKNQFIIAFSVAILSGLAAVTALWAAPNESPILALTAAGMILVPGVPLINGIREVTSGDAANGVARLVTGTALVLAIGFALYTVGYLTGAELPVDVGPGSLDILQDLLFAGLAAVGFALLFNVPPSAVGFCVVAGMTSHGLRTALEQIHLTLPISSLLGALAAGLVARFAARLHRVPAVVFAFPGVVAMIPGSFGFRAGIGGLQLMADGAASSPSLVATTLSLMITTAVTTVAIAIGLTLALSGSSDEI